MEIARCSSGGEERSRMAYVHARALLLQRGPSHSYIYTYISTSRHLISYSLVVGNSERCGSSGGRSKEEEARLEVGARPLLLCTGERERERECSRVAV
jgi:3-dehydroquinate synthase class II